MKKTLIFTALVLALSACSAGASEAPASLQPNKSTPDTAMSTPTVSPTSDVKFELDNEQLDTDTLSGDLSKDIGALELLSRQIIHSPMASWTFERDSVKQLNVTFDESINQYKNLTDNGTVYAFVTDEKSQSQFDGTTLTVTYTGHLAQSPYIDTNNANQVARDMQLAYLEDGVNETPKSIIFTFTLTDNNTRATARMEVK